MTNMAYQSRALFILAIQLLKQIRDIKVLVSEVSRLLCHNLSCSMFLLSTRIGDSCNLGGYRSEF